MDSNKAEFREMLDYMISKYRSLNPNDPRSDVELGKSLLEHFYRKGLLGKRDGKYLIPTLVDDDVETLQ